MEVAVHPLPSAVWMILPDHGGAISKFLSLVVVTFRLSLPGLPPSSTGARAE
jgi:hypothetical protein